MWDWRASCFEASFSAKIWPLQLLILDHIRITGQGRPQGVILPNLLLKAEPTRFLIRCLRTLLSQILKTSKNGDSTTSPGDLLFQCFITLIVGNFPPHTGNSKTVDFLTKEQELFLHL